ncbi:MAG: type II toxin-antitoxin system VapC family toxin [Burkholderiaceae bacterium]|jgi:predicted nucleic-acid-binding protein|nr:type II toxin-antitoxin system VapC family toxin [Burkholderiaceae bacterium]
MITLDTNLLVRLVMNDDKPQVAAGLRVLRRADRVLLLNTVLQETVWVLQSVYDASREDVLNALRHILSIATPENPAVARALEWFGDGMDFADALHLAAASAARCDTLYSFDKSFVKAAAGKTACAVTRP